VERPARWQEVFVGNRGKSLDFFVFNLALEKGYFKKLGLDVTRLSISSKPGQAR
jgi:ABC-type nitrate/sulfonate/bicarbonate transport system substrate-binding protein